ncbi:MAG: T9SS type A sorting domain-containing protein [Chitinophagales bacterium]
MDRNIFTIFNCLFCVLFLSSINIGLAKAENITNRVYNIFQANCTTSGCHSHADAIGNLDLEGGSNSPQQDAYANVFKVIPTNIGSQIEEKYIVYPGQPYKSTLFTYIGSEENGNITLNDLEDENDLHKNLDISPLDKEMIRQWIFNGAKTYDEGVDTELIEEFYNGQGIWSIDPLNAPEKPAASEGFQIRIGPIFVPASDIVGGNLTDVIYDVRHDLLNDNNIEFDRIVASIGSSHHFDIFEYANTEMAQEEPYGLVEDKLHNNTNTVCIFTQSTDYNLPQGSAMYWKEQIILDLQTHIINYSDEFILAQDVYLNIYTQPEGTASQELKFKNYGKTDINVPINVENYEEEISIFLENAAQPNIYVWGIGSHTHSHGQDFDIWLRNPDGSKGEHIYDASNYNGVPECEFIGYSYETPPIRTFDYPFIYINMEHGVISQAKYFNDLDEPIIFGSNTTTQEMLGTGFFYVTDTTGVSFNEGSLCYSDEINGISTTEKIDKLSINIFPNPIKQNAQINIASYFTGNIIGTLYDLNGKIIRQEKHFIPSNNEVHSFAFEKENLENGMYLYEITDQKGNRKVERLIITQ